jgi:hypothetical protein
LIWFGNAVTKRTLTSTSLGEIFLIQIGHSDWYPPAGRLSCAIMVVVLISLPLSIVSYDRVLYYLHVCLAASPGIQPEVIHSIRLPLITSNLVGASVIKKF